MTQCRGNQPRYFIENNRVKFNWLNCIGRVRKTRSRMQRAMTYITPIRVVDYKTPAFYYSEIMEHRRKRDTDWGVSKVRNGIIKANKIMERYS